MKIDNLIRKYTGLVKERFIKKDESDKNIQIGLDIGTHSVKAIALSHSSPKKKLLGFSVRLAGGDIIKAVKEAYAEINPSQNKVVTSVSGAGVIVRYVEMPAMNEEELRSAARFEAEKVIPYNLNDVIIDSARIEDVGKNRMRVIIVAVKKDVVNTLIRIINEAGLEPVAMDIDSFALMNAFESCGIDKENVCGLLNIGSKRSNLNIVKGGVSYLCRDIEIGGNNILKLIGGGDSAGGENDPNLLAQKLATLAQLPRDDRGIIGKHTEEVILHLADEVRLSFDFYENQHAGGVNKIYISGGMAASAVIEEFLKESLGREILRWDPLSGIEMAEGLDMHVLDKIRAQFAVSVGLGLRSIL